MSTFDIERFNKILKTIQGKKSLNEFAYISKIDSAYLSRIINKKRSNPPSPNILKRIADASKGITTYEELMQVCGYIEIERTPIEDGAIKALEDMVARQVPGYSLIDITLRYIKRIEGKNVNN